MKAWMQKAFRREPLQELPTLASPLAEDDDDLDPFGVPALVNHPFWTVPGMPAVSLSSAFAPAIRSDLSTDYYVPGSFFSGDNAQVALTAPLNNIFDTYRALSDGEDDVIGIQGAFKFFRDIGVQLDEVVCIAIAELCKCPSVGEFTREGFVAGWRSVNVGNIPLMVQYTERLRQSLRSDPELFRRVYRFCFPMSRMQGQRNVQFEIAKDQWAMFFGPGSGNFAANTATTPWLTYWIEYLEGRGKKPISKDLWNQFEVFVPTAKGDESLGWWDPAGAWPGVIDEFVPFVLAKRASLNSTEMETE